MITNFKIFEKYKNNIPEIGDFVICSELDSSTDVTKFTSTHIGQYIEHDSNPVYNLVIFYDNIPDELDAFFRDNTRNMSEEEIEYFSKDKEHLEKILLSKKFNI